MPLYVRVTRETGTTGSVFGRKPSVMPGRSAGVLQRCGGRQCPPGECDHSDESLLARSPAGVGPTSVPPIVSKVLASPGRPLDPVVRTDMATRFRYDFSQVRVHTDATAATSAQAVDALAYTVGNDIVFGNGRYEPHSPRGRRLLAHELTHVIQQGPIASRPSVLRLGAANDPLEQLADQAAAETSAATVTPAVVTPAIQRQTATGAPRQAAGDRAQAHKCLHTPPPPGRLRPVGGERVETLLESRIVTVVEIGAAAWCCPCIDLQLDLDSLAGEFYRSDPQAPIRFFTVDIDDPRNSDADQRWAKEGIPRLLIYAGTAERKNLFGTMPSADALKEMLTDEIHYVSHSGAATGAKWGLLGGALAGLAGGAIAAMAIGGPVGLLVGLGVLAGGAALGLGGGALIGHLTDRRDRPSAERVGSFEADTLIRKTFGSSLRKGPGPLHGARIVPVTKAELPALKKCRDPGNPALAGEAIGWTDFGAPAAVSKSTGNGPTASTAGQRGAEPTCPGRQLEHATPEQPVIYYAVDADDATILIHEGLHAYGDTNWRATVGNWRPDEAVTEYFTQEIAREIGAPESHSIYETYVPYVKRLVDRIGEQALRDAFFKGDFAPADSVLGNQGLEEWAARLAAGSSAEGDSPDDVLKTKKDYGGGGSVLGPPQAPPASGARPQTGPPSR